MHWYAMRRVVDSGRPVIMHKSHATDCRLIVPFHTKGRTRSRRPSVHRRRRSESPGLGRGDWSGVERAQLRRAPVSRDRCARTRFGPLRSSCLIVDCEGCPLDTRAPPVRPFVGAVRRVAAVRVARRLSLLEELSQAHSAIDKKRLDGGSSPELWLWVGVRRSRLA